MRKLLLGLIVLLLPAASLAQDFVRYYPPSGFTVGTGGTLTATGPLLLPDGSASAPSLSWSSIPSSGFYRLNVSGAPSQGVIGVAVDGTFVAKFDNQRIDSGGGFSVSASRFLGFSANSTDTTAVDVRLYRDAANTLALRNSTNAQTFNLYNTYTDGSNYEVGKLYWSGNTFVLGVGNAGTGTARAMQIGNGATGLIIPVSMTPDTADSKNLGDSRTWMSGYFSRSIQGSKSKTLTDNTATAFVRLSVADDDYEGCGVIYTAFAEDADTDARQTRTGKIYAAILNNSGTESVVFSTGDSAVNVTAGTLTCTFDGNSASADTIDLRATCNTSLDAAAETLTFEYRLDCPSTVTVTPQ